MRGGTQWLNRGEGAGTPSEEASRGFGDGSDFRWLRLREVQYTEVSMLVCYECLEEGGGRMHGCLVGCLGAAGSVAPKREMLHKDRP